MLKPERPGEPWTDLFVQKGCKSFKLFINQDACEQQQRLQAIQRKIRDAFAELHPSLVVSLPKPLFAPNMPMQGIVRIEKQDVVVIRADSKHSPHRFKYEPSAVDRHKLQIDAITARTNQLLAQSSRALDTSGWLG
eukprot:2999405-Karenia_brevis.AAC.1